MFSPTASTKDKRLNLIDWEAVSVLPTTKAKGDALGFGGAVIGIYKDQLIIAGGTNFPGDMPWEGGNKKYYDDIHVYIKDKKKIKYQKIRSRFPTSIAYAGVCSTPNGIVIAGGENDDGISNKVFLLQCHPVTSAIQIASLPDLPLATTNASIVSKDNIIYLAGGETEKGISDKFYLLDLNLKNHNWIPMPALPAAISFTAAAVQGNGSNACIYLLGGKKRLANGVSKLYDTIYEFNLASNLWSLKITLPYVVCAGACIAIGAENIFLFGGDKGIITKKVETLIAAINTETNEARKQLLILEKNKIQIAHPGFSRDVIQFNTISNTCAVIDTIPFDGPVTTTVLSWNGDIVLPGGEIRPGVRSALIQIGKFKQVN